VDVLDRTWHQKGRGYLRRLEQLVPIENALRSKREARNIIKKRKQAEHATILKAYYAIADAGIEEFIVKVQKRRGKK
jgi:hypothetical protein